MFFLTCSHPLQHWRGGLQGKNKIVCRLSSACMRDHCCQYSSIVSTCLGIYDRSIRAIAYFEFNFPLRYVSHFFAPPECKGNNMNIYIWNYFNTNSRHVYTHISCIPELEDIPSAKVQLMAKYGNVIHLMQFLSSDAYLVDWCSFAIWCKQIFTDSAVRRCEERFRNLLCQRRPLSEIRPAIIQY